MVYYGSQTNEYAAYFFQFNQAQRILEMHLTAADNHSFHD